MISRECHDINFASQCVVGVIYLYQSLWSRYRCWAVVRICRTSQQVKGVKTFFIKMVCVCECMCVCVCVYACVYVCVCVLEN